MNYGEFKANEKEAKRKHNEKEDPFRSGFSLDRERIMHSKEFRRLSGKTQVFVCGFDDNMRTRLTHTLEVAQISEIISDKLGLNSILCEAISFGHDVGHTPFGHAGEKTLNLIMNGCINIKGFNKKINFTDNTKGFKHNWQGVRVVTELERISPKYFGLNLTNFTIWGILNHSKLLAKKCDSRDEEANKCLKFHEGNECVDETLSLDYYEKYKSGINFSTDWTIEAIIVDIADEIAQRHHDIEDGIRAKIINIKDVLEKFEKTFKVVSIDKSVEEKINVLKDKSDSEIIIEELSKIIIDFYIKNAIDDLSTKLDIIKSKYNITGNDDFHAKKNQVYSELVVGKVLRINDVIGQSDVFRKCDKTFQEYLSSRIINSQIAQSMDGKSTFIITKLFYAYVNNPQQLSDKTIQQFLINYYEGTESKSDFEKQPFGELRLKLEKLHDTTDLKKYRIVLLRTICDHISGMSDRFALDQYEILYGTKYIRNF